MTTTFVFEVYGANLTELREAATSRLRALTGLAVPLAEYNLTAEPDVETNGGGVVRWRGRVEGFIIEGSIQ